MTPKERRAWLRELAYETRGRLDHALEALEDDSFADEEVKVFERLVEDTFFAAFGERTTLRWLRFVQAIEGATLEHQPSTPDAAVARVVIDDYARIFPDLACKLEGAKVTAAVRAWREDRNYFRAIHAALVDVVAAVPTARTMATRWSKLTKRTPWLAPSVRRPRRRGEPARPRGVHAARRSS